MIVRCNASLARRLLLSKLMSGSSFGTFWTMREIVILLSLMLAIYVFWSRKRPPIIDEIISWLNLALGLALLTAVALSGHAAAATSNVLVYAILADWLHLLAASLWIGGMMYLAVIYLSVLKGESLAKCTWSRRRSRYAWQLATAFASSHAR